MSEHKTLLVLDKHKLQIQLSDIKKEHAEIHAYPMEDDYEDKLKRLCNLYGRILILEQILAEGGTGEDIFDAGREGGHYANETIFGLEVTSEYEYPRFVDYLFNLAKV